MADGNQRPRIAPNGGVGYPRKRMTALSRPKATLGPPTHGIGTAYGPVDIPQPHSGIGAAQGPTHGVTYSPTGIVQAAQPAPDFRDSTYGAGAASLLRRNAFDRGDVTQQGITDRSNFDTGLARLARARSQDLLGSTSAANRNGLLYSSTLGKQRGGIEQDYLNRENDSRQALGGREAARATALSRLGTVRADDSNPLGFTGTGDAGDELFGLAQQAVERRRVANQDTPVPVPNAPDPFKTVVAPNSKGQKGAWHVYPGGRKVFVRS